MKKILAISILVFLIGYAIYNTVIPTNAKVGVIEGNAAPNFELTTLAGDKMNLTDLKGKKVLVNFWATWCPPCRSEMPDMQKIYDEYNGEVIIAAVNLTSSESSVDTVENFVNDLNLTFPIFLDEKGKVNNEYEVLSYPTSYFIDEDGIIKTKFVGALSYDQMKKFISDL
ncbi:redoxin domain-containing protein [Metabacillus litoralis]|uniref:redoxin domain-containing protein n=1 Tax=Metabacillus litoralis TaxID=152268 RepID=UPI001CFCC240|nr:redoxin domain-containing protein [Metabacillus litoralis]